MAAAAAVYVNSESKFFSALVCTNSARFDGQAAQQARQDGGRARCAEELSPHVGNAGTVSPGTSGRYGWLPVNSCPSPVIWADSTAGTASPRLLYQAISGSNVRAYADTDAVGHAALAN
jgi:hypothetical protein